MKLFLARLATVSVVILCAAGTVFATPGPPVVPAIVPTTFEISWTGDGTFVQLQELAPGRTYGLAHYLRSLAGLTIANELQRSKAN